MLGNNWDTQLREGLNPGDLCRIIEEECQPGILECCKKIDEYFASESNGELQVAVSELVQLLFTKLQDELHHFFLKESGIVFQGIKKATPDFCINGQLTESILHTQKVITNLLLKLRQLLNNYVVRPQWSKEWKSCVNEFFLLENKIHQWIYIEQSLLYPAIASKPSSL